MIKGDKVIKNILFICYVNPTKPIISRISWYLPQISEKLVKTRFDSVTMVSLIIQNSCVYFKFCFHL